MDYKLKLKQISNNCDVVKINDDAIGFAVAGILRDSKENLFLHITTDDKRMDELARQINFFVPEVEILTIPAWDCLPYDRVSPKAAVVSARVKAFSALAKRSDQKTLIITTANSALQKTIPVNLIKNLGFGIAVGDEVKIEDLTGYLVSNGYSRSSVANSVGEFAVRGSIVDIIIPSSYQRDDDLIGYRLDFFGNNLEEIRVFDPLTQITSNKVKKIDFLPTSEIIFNEKNIDNFRKNYRQLFGAASSDIMYNAVTGGRNYPGMEHFLPLFYDEELSSIFTHAKNAVHLIEAAAFDSIKQRENVIREYYQARVETLKESANSGGVYNPIPPENLYLSKKEFENELTKNGKFLVKFNNFNADLNGRIIDLEFDPIPNLITSNKNSYEALKEFLHNHELLDRKILIACFSNGSRDRLHKILLEHEIASKAIENLEEKLPKNNIGLIILPVSQGFYASDVVLVGEEALVGLKINRKISRKIDPRILAENLALQAGELVVHRYHGIGKFDGLQTITAGGITNDFLKIIYGGGDNLFVPVEDIELITRYGADNPLIQLDRLGLATWKNRCDKVRKKIKVAAEELIKIAAARQLKKAPILVADPGEYEEFKARFEFVETDDQLRTIDEVEEDLTKGMPMDRLVCGDVGFGKTEVAMRAAFTSAKNASGSYQVAVIAPTTLLCRQHYHNFTKRFKDTGLQVAQLSRMVTPAEAKKTKQDLADGKINIVIGTHALLAKDVKFSKLGLIILDEEQHFGVAQKERVKQLRNEVHILTLSATPIPRTLQMSLTGVKELSLISTPPIDRLAIRSFVMPYDSVIAREAILREYQRGGRTFFVVPKIKDIGEIEDRLKKLIPEVKIQSVHGQMTPATLDKIMNDFYDGKFDVLISTTIIESGIDISIANTMIIHKAENFGLSQLYQLRGRVGRGKVRAYAYLMTTAGKKLTEVAQKRLEVMQTLDALGVGFSIASHDMDIRGSGNILGDEQSGHVRETGIELYQDMLRTEIENLKSRGGAASSEIAPSEEYVEDYSVQIKLGISLLIPEDYIPDLSLRMSLYKRIARIDSKATKEQIATEIIDRFGPLPNETDSLLEIAYLKSLCKKCDIEKVESGSGGILISFRNNKFKEPQKLLDYIFKHKDKIKLQGHKVLFIMPITSEKEKFNSSLKVINQIEGLLQ